MSLRRVGGLAAVALAMMVCLSCGDIYRPVVIPIAITPPNSANFHAVFGISANAQINPGAALQIDVSGDTDIGQANIGINPTHAAILPNNSRVFVASAGSFFPGQSDVVSAFAPAFSSNVATGLGTPSHLRIPMWDRSVLPVHQPGFAPISPIFWRQPRPPGCTSPIMAWKMIRGAP